MSSQTERLMTRAEHLYSIGQLDGAIDTLREALTDDPDLGEAHAWLAACLIRKRRLHAADMEARMALTLEPDMILSHWVGAELGLAKRDFESAGRHIEALLARAPEQSAFHLLKARWLSLSHREAEILPVLERARECDPEDPDTLAELAQWHCRKGDLAEAVRYATEALTLSAENQAALIAMGHVLLAQGDTEGAREHALAALQSDPEDTGALGLLTQIKARSNPLLGLWWRYAAWGQRVGPTQNIIVLLIAFVVYRVLTIATADAGATGLSAGIQIAWLAVVVYSFAGPAIFHRALKKELSAVQLKKF